jgi:hypothetical protein
MRMNCAPPAAPSWFTPAPPPKPVVAPGPLDRLTALWEAILGWWRGWWPF